MIKVYAYSGCSTCRNALKFLKGAPGAARNCGHPGNTAVKAELKRMLTACGGQIRRLFNTSGQDYRALGLSAKLDSMSLDEALTLLSGNESR